MNRLQKKDEEHFQEFFDEVQHLDHVKRRY